MTQVYSVMTSITEYLEARQGIIERQIDRHKDQINHNHLPKAYKALLKKDQSELRTIKELLKEARNA